MTKSNEVAVQNENTYDAETGEIITANKFQPKVVDESNEFIVYEMPNGKYIRKAKYKEINTVVSETREDKIWLLNLMDSGEGEGVGQSLKEHVGKEITVQDVITRKYDSIDEDTGELIYGVLTYLITPDKEVFVTSSKSVYFSIWNIMDLFGKPDSDNWENIVLKVGSVKLPNGTGLTIKMIG